MMQITCQTTYDVVIIGAGVGGLTAASILSKAGLSVCVLEKEPHAGGYLAGFRRNSFRFDTAIHWLNQCAPGGVVDKIFSILGTDYPKAIPQKRIRRFIGPNHNYLLTNNPDELKAQWKKEFPNEQSGIDRFFMAAKKIGAAFNNYAKVFRTEESMDFWKKLKNKLPLIEFGTAFIPYLRFSGEKGLQKGLNKFFTEKKLQDVFAADSELIGCLVPIGWAYYKDFQSPPIGGGQVIPEWLQHIVKYYESDIFFNSKVEKILVENNLATSVQFSCRGAKHNIKADYIIATSDVETLYNQLFPADIISHQFKKKLNDAELYSSSVTLSIALDCPTESLGFNEEMVHIAVPVMDGINVSNHNILLSEISIIAPSVRDKTLAPEGNGTLTIYAPAQFCYNNYWLTKKETGDNYIRTEAYRKLKTEIAEALLKHVETVFAPGLRTHILFYDVATPITHWRYTGNKNGTMMGAKPGSSNMKNKIAHYRTPVKNVLLGGHWAELGGGVPIAVKAGSNAALLVMQKKNRPAFEKLAQYMDGKITANNFLQSKVFKEYNNGWVRKPTPAEREALKNKS